MHQSQSNKCQCKDLSYDEMCNCKHFVGAGIGECLFTYTESTKSNKFADHMMKQVKHREMRNAIGVASIELLIDLLEVHIEHASVYGGDDIADKTISLLKQIRE